LRASIFGYLDANSNTSPTRSIASSAQIPERTTRQTAGSMPINVNTC
jgi:hypothetical protein